MSATTNLIDDAPLTSFHKKLTAYSSGGPFIDGYALTVIGIALITLAPALGLSASDIGLVGAASLVGVFVGGAVFGWVTDKVGRQVMYIVDLLVLAVVSIASAFVSDLFWLVLFRFILGVAIGADYPIATSLLAEFLPKKGRGRMLGAVFVVWAVGAAAAFGVGFALKGLGPDAWRYLLASPAVFAIITLLFRLGTPESPRWLISKGKMDQADAVIKKVYGQEYGLADVASEVEETTHQAKFSDVFKPPYLKRTIFIGVFWTAQVIPLFAVYTFAPELLASFGLTGDANLYGGSLIIALLFVIGGIPGLYLVEKIGRRALLLWSFGIIMVALAIPVFFPSQGAWLLFSAIAIFALVSGGSSFLEIVYPNELFPTEVRATAVGVGTAFSRLGSAASTYLMPIALVSLGAGGALAIGAAITLLGFLVTLAWAPETRNRSLAELTSSTVPSTDEEGTSGSPYPLPNSGS